MASRYRWEIGQRVQLYRDMGAGIVERRRMEANPRYPRDPVEDYYLVRFAGDLRWCWGYQLEDVPSET